MSVFECGVILFIVISNIIAITMLATHTDEQLSGLYRATSQLFKDVDELEERIHELDLIIQVMERKQ